MRDSKLYEISAGTSELHTLIMGRALNSPRIVLNILLLDYASPCSVTRFESAVCLGLRHFRTLQQISLAPHDIKDFLYTQGLSIIRFFDSSQYMSYSVGPTLRPHPGSMNLHSLCDKSGKVCIWDIVKAEHIFKKEYKLPPGVQVTS